MAQVTLKNTTIEKLNVVLVNAYGEQEVVSIAADIGGVAQTIAVDSAIVAQSKDVYAKIAEGKIVVSSGSLPEYSAPGSLPIPKDLSSTAVDAEVVHLAGAETITGVKTFSAAPVLPASFVLPASIPVSLSTPPAAATTAGTKGQIAIKADGTALYICVTTGAEGSALWKTVALSAIE